MGIDYTYSCFYGIELDIEMEKYYEVEEGFDYSGPVSIELFGDFVNGDPKPAAYIRSTLVDNDSYRFGLFRLEESEDMLSFNNLLRNYLEGIQVIGKPGWFFAASVS